MTTDNGMDVVVTETPSATIARQAAEIERLRNLLRHVIDNPGDYDTQLVYEAISNE